jgi:hypothetical protein
MDKDVVEKGGDTLDVVDVDANDSAEAEVVYIDEATSRRIGRRLDRLLLPLMVCHPLVPRARELEPKLQMQLQS